MNCDFCGCTLKDHTAVLPYTTLVAICNNPACTEQRHYYLAPEPPVVQSRVAEVSPHGYSVFR